MFYHLERARLEHVLPNLLEKTLARGWRAVVKCGSRAGVDRIDEALWTYADDSFLPHGAPTNAEEARREKIWLTETDETWNSPDLIFLVDGASTPVDQLDQFERCLIIFDGADETALLQAREFWSAVKAAGHDGAYWRQSETGQWEKQ